MSSIRTPGGKRGTLPRASDHTKSFAKDWVRLTHSGRFNMKQLREAMLLLFANDGQLPQECQDHQPVSDCLPIYRLESRGTHEVIILVRAGTHADLFEQRSPARCVTA